MISVSKLAEKGINCLFTKDSVRLLSADTGVEIVSGPHGTVQDSTTFH